MSGYKRRVRNEIDDFLESEGYYRKLIPQESNSLYLALSDLLYNTQKGAGALQEEVAFDKSTEDESPYNEVEFVSFKLGIKIQVIESPSFTSILTFGSKTTSRSLLLSCYKTPNHFDAVFSSTNIQNKGLAQSIIYECLYSSVFNLRFSMEAAAIMLHESSEEKPIVYDKKFSGTALEALDHFLIPFPYKVAKALDPSIYRNIDFDVWSNKNGGDISPGVVCSCEKMGKKDGVWIGTPWRGRPNFKSSPYTFTQLEDSKFFKSESDPKANELKEDDQSESPAWLQKFDFSVPPPNISESPKFIVKSVYPILGECPVLLENPEESSTKSSLANTEDFMHRERRMSVNRPPPLIIPSCSNSQTPFILSPITFSPSPVLTLTPCSPELCVNPYFIWPNFY